MSVIAGDGIAAMRDGGLTQARFSDPFGVVVAPDGREVPFEFDESTRHRLLNGLEDIALTLRHEDEIAAYEAAHGIA